MAHYQAKMSSKGQLTIPTAVREHFNLKTGDIAVFYVDDADRSVHILARNNSIFDGLEELRLPPRGSPVTLAELDGAIGEYLAEKHERISGARMKKLQCFLTCLYGKDMNNVRRPR